MGALRDVLTIDGFGRIHIPKKLREELELTPGTKINVYRSGNSLILERSGQ